MATLLDRVVARVRTYAAPLGIQVHEQKSLSDELLQSATSTSKFSEVERAALSPRCCIACLLAGTRPACLTSDATLPSSSATTDSAGGLAFNVLDGYPVGRTARWRQNEW